MGITTPKRPNKANSTPKFPNDIVIEFQILNLTIPEILRLKLPRLNKNHHLPIPK